MIEQLLPIIKIIIWPIAFIILVWVFLITFRRDVASILTRVQRVGRDGVSMMTQSVNVSSASFRTAEELLESVIVTPVLSKMEQTIRQEIKDKRLEESDRCQDVLIRHLASSQLSTFYESVYGEIWGGQIKILQRLNSSRPEGAHIDQIKPLYEEITQQYPNIINIITFSKYWNFLESNQLVITKENMVVITDLGVEFLTYLIRSGKNLNKGF